MKVDFEVLTDVRKGEMFAICLNDTLVCLESQGKKKKQNPASNNSGGMQAVSKSDAGDESRPTADQRAWSSARAAKREQQVG